MKNLVILIPYPAQGHVTPMVNLGRAIHVQGFQPILITPESIHARLCRNSKEMACDSVLYMSIPDGRRGKQNDFFSIEKAMEEEMPLHLENIIRQLEEEEEEEGVKVVCLVVDLLASWAVQVGKRKGVSVAGFWPVMASAYRLLDAIPEMVQTGLISESGIPIKQDTKFSLPEQPLICANDLPWMIGDLGSRKARFKFWIRTLQRSTSITHLLVNSFSGEECCWDDGVSRKSRISSTIVLPIGALNMHAQVRTSTPSFWEEDTDCLQWLDEQRSCSVLYISFGSWVSPIAETKIKSLARALEETSQPFLWVLGSAWRQGLSDGFLQRVSERGKLVLWAPQRKVLEHKAVGCYLSHCGWNSTMEAIRFQKKLLCYPLAGDQFINCRYIVDVWKIGTEMRNLDRQDLEQGMKILIGNEEMSSKLAELNAKFMGEKAVSEAMDNLNVFIRYMQNITQ